MTQRVVVDCDFDDDDCDCHLDYLQKQRHALMLKTTVMKMTMDFQVKRMMVLLEDKQVSFCFFLKWDQVEPLMLSSLL